MPRLNSGIYTYLNLALVAALVTIGVLVSLVVVPRIVEWIFRLFDPMAATCAEKDTAGEEQAFAEFAEKMAAERKWDPAPPESLALPNPARPVRSAKAARENNLPAQFRREASAALTAARMMFSGLSAAENPARQKMFKELSGMIAGLKDKAPQPAMHPFWLMAGAQEALLERLAKKPSDVTPSALHTVAYAFDMLSHLCIPGTRADLATVPAIRILAVDDDPVCLTAISFALQKVLSPPDLAPDGPTALTFANEAAYDAVFLDVEMPGMDGFEVCSRIHETTANRFTPIVFVTRHSDFDSRAKSSLSGGRDLIGKPFMVFELPVKALTIILDHRLRAPMKAPAQSVEGPQEPAPV